MDWFLETKVEEDIFIATIVGTMNKSAYLAARDNVLSLFKDTSYARHILIDIRGAILDVSVMDVLEVALSSQEVIPLGIKYAIVFSSKTLPERDVLFGETVAINRGASLRSFNDIEVAKQWLTGKATE